MTKDNNMSESHDRDDVALAELLRMAGQRKQVPEDVEARVYERVRREWSDTLPRERGESRVYKTVRREWQRNAPSSRRPRWLMPFAVAASVLTIAGILLQPAPDTPAPVIVATVVAVNGNTGADLPAVGAPLHAGDQIETGTRSGVTLQLNSGESIRIDEQTILSIVGRDHFRLDNGRVYADTGDRIYRDNGLVVDTDMGRVTDVGTQFSVTMQPDALAIAVREGRVDLAHGSDDIVTVAGERMTLERGGEPQVSRLVPHDPYWDWVTALSPAFEINDKSLLDLLRWASRETGRELVFEDPELRLAAMRTDLHGSIEALAPVDAVEAVLATTRFRYRIEDDRIIIER